MGWNRIEEFGPYKDGIILFEHVLEDMNALRNDPRSYRLIGQQVGSADSICANMDEGYGRLSRTELIRFFDIARGSARETRGRYLRLKEWLSKEVIEQRVKLLDSIIARLTKSINTLRSQNDTRKKHSGGNQVREDVAAYGACPAGEDSITDEDLNTLLSPDTRHPLLTRHPTLATRHP